MITRLSGPFDKIGIDIGKQMDAITEKLEQNPALAIAPPKKLPMWIVPAGIAAGLVGILVLTKKRKAQ